MYVWGQRLLLVGAFGMAAAAAFADGTAGAYLAGRSAAQNGDLGEAAVQFQRASEGDPRHRAILNTAITMQVAVGDVAGAEALAAPALASGHDSRAAALVAIAAAARHERWTDLLALLDAGHSGGPLLDGLARGWALTALGREDAARAMFDELAELEGLGTVARHHGALALGSDGEGVTPAEGLASAFLTVGSAVRGEVDDSFALIHLRLAHHVDPASDRALVSAGMLLRDMGRHALAAQVLSGVAEDSPLWPEAALGRAFALRDSGADGEAADLLERLADGSQDLAVLAALGDLHRDAGRIAEANTAFGRALSLAAEDDPRRWVLHFGRAVTHDLLDDWTSAEADLRAALALAPGTPLLLNYLGYGLVERRQDLDEALGMIRAAVAQEPEDGAFADSLGWALFVTGDHAGAVRELERAVELSPSDPVIVDHLGDVYWAVGRRIEARYQWRRALGLTPPPPLTARLEGKLDRGIVAAAAAPQEETHIVTVANGDHPQTR
ncbi:tetratricopeptide repeat protein [Histidinibacterium lentulum]|uniref:Tetratricopeptide repeat protein n=1 Tax=Histidinibacterium lentulum TaxID=2480588 RepID=A0A3N2QW19_9RHOB|nr:tetratricopeptide repeat protein [Histidinibacterium lentulum]ROT99362.1 hypothetical protein EAT49_14170 [Histidinibacterium lentulum]